MYRVDVVGLIEIMNARNLSCTFYSNGRARGMTWKGFARKPVYPSGREKLRCLFVLSARIRKLITRREIWSKSDYLSNLVLTINVKRNFLNQRLAHRSWLSFALKFCAPQSSADIADEQMIHCEFTRCSAYHRFVYDVVKKFPVFPPTHRRLWLSCINQKKLCDIVIVLTFHKI